MTRNALLIAVSTGLLLMCPPVVAQNQRWSEQQARDWYGRQPVLIGSNYIPASAVNQLEMWQADTFDPAQIEKEFGWAEQLGMNTMRVFLHDLLWQQDAKGFKSRIDAFLAIAARHHIRPIFVLFDSCWNPDPKLGPQPPPIPGVHNSRWVQSPGAVALADPAQQQRLQNYVEGVVTAFANDPRILAWDLWNEPDNLNGAAVGEARNKTELVAALLPKVFAWARSAHPFQPLTSGLWQGSWASLERVTPIQRTQLLESDILSFHHYGWAEDFEQRIVWLEAYGRPVLCTEFMARSVGSVLDTILPIAKKHHVGVINWGLVAGKTQTNLPWDSWQHPYTQGEPPVWFHDLFRPDGKLYREHEGELIRGFTKEAAGTAQSMAPLNLPASLLLPAVAPTRLPGGPVLPRTPERS